MMTALNLLAAVLLLLFVLLRDRFRDAFAQLEKDEPRDYSVLRLLLGPTVLLLAVFVGLATWSLAAEGLIAPALLLVAHVVFLLDLAWSRRPSQR